MLEKTLEDLEFTTVFLELRSLCLSEEGQGVLDRKHFITEAQELIKAQDAVQDMLDIISSGVREPESFPPLSAVMAELSVPERSLEGSMLWDVANYLHSGRLFTEFCHTPSVQEDVSRLSAALFEPFPPELAGLETHLFDVLESPGVVKSTHPAIRALKAEVERRRSERQAYSLEFLRSQPHIAQADQPAFRDGRIVLPIKNDQRGSVDGFVHSTSSSGATVYIEPYRLVELNNRVVLAEQQILIEIARILHELSSEVRRLLVQLEELSSRVGVADSILARCRYARRHHCVRALVGSDRTFRLLQARHPLLKDHAVPISIVLEPHIAAVVISGPNAGGKTVTIKTMGLFALMNQFFHVVPAAEGTTLPLFEAVYTDIGDDQSIEASLSTFSGHMKRIGNILQVCDATSLVILDELGSGTDPVEGSAIARAVLEYCVDQAALTLVTSHHGVLKQYAYANPRVINASMEFDEATHQPTFRVIGGIPGESHALETARRMHVPERVLKAAAAYIGSENMEISSIIRHLEERRKEAEQSEAALQERWSVLRREIRQVDLQRLQVRQRELHVRNEQIGDLSRFMTEKRAELENLVAELREGEITREKTLKVKAFIASLEQKETESRQQFVHLKEAAEKLSEQDAAGDGQVGFKAGMDVLAGPSKREGRIIRAAGQGKWVVAIGPMKFTLAQKDLRPVVNVRAGERKVSVSYETSAVVPKPTVDVRGQTLQAALETIATQIESALVHSVGSFSIIHGMGEGILAKGIHEYLSKVPQVTKYHYARPEDGGFGKTYVEF
jgi:DNA mismatch repair protein MutS2